MKHNRIWNLAVKMTPHGLSRRCGILSLLVLKSTEVHWPLQGSFLTRNSSKAVQPPPTLTISVLRRIRTIRSCWESPNCSKQTQTRIASFWFTYCCSILKLNLQNITHVSAFLSPRYHIWCQKNRKCKLHRFMRGHWKIRGLNVKAALMHF